MAQLPAALDGIDGVDFALALGDYDPGLDQPHPPGYPLYILLCRMMAALGAGEVAALALPGILASPALVLATASVARRMDLSPGARLGASLWLAFHPLLLAEGARPAPDLLGASAAWSALALALAGRAAAAGTVFGLAIGVRPDLAPFALLLAGIGRGARARFAAAAALGALAWLAPLAALAPPEWLTATARFASGHFSVWGSSALAGAGDPAASLRGLALLASGPAGALLAAWGVRRVRWPRALALTLLAEALWITLGQNLAHARHWLPLAPAGALLGAAGLTALARPRARAWIAIMSASLVLPVWWAAQRARLDGAALVASAVAACGAGDPVYAGASARLFERYAPRGFPIYRRFSLAEIRLDLAAWGLDQARICATDEIAGVAARGVRVGGAGPIRLYRIEAAALR